MPVQSVNANIIAGTNFKSKVGPRGESTAPPASKVRVAERNRTPPPVQDFQLRPEASEVAAVLKRMSSLEKEIAATRNRSTNLMSQLFQMETVSQSSLATERVKIAAAEEAGTIKIGEAQRELDTQEAATEKAAELYRQAQGREFDARQKLDQATKALEESIQRREALETEVATTVEQTQQHHKDSQLTAARIAQLDAKKAQQEANKEKMAEELKIQEMEVLRAKNEYDTKRRVVDNLQKKIEELQRNRRGASASSQS